MVDASSREELPEARLQNDGEPKQPDPETAPTQKIVLNVGCGYAPRQNLHETFRGAEWREIRFDIDPSVRPDIVGSMTDMRAVEPDSVDAVWSSHTLEHLQRHEVPLALREFLRVLRPGGMLMVNLPDLQRIAALVAADRLEDEAYRSASGPVTPLDMIYGHTPSLARGHKAMAHRTGFTARTLHKQLTLAGFAPIQVSQTGSFDLKAVAHKPAVHRSTAQGPTADKLAVEAAVGRQAAD